MDAHRIRAIGLLGWSLCVYLINTSVTHSMYQSVGQLTHLDLDLSSVCNAFCWDCNRHWHRRGVQYQNPLLTTINRTYPFDRLISDLDQLTHIRVVDICGNSGDPFSHPDLASI